MLQAKAYVGWESPLLQSDFVIISTGEVMAIGSKSYLSFRLINIYIQIFHMYNKLTSWILWGNFFTWCFVIWGSQTLTVAQNPLVLPSEPLLSWVHEPNFPCGVFPSAVLGNKIPLSKPGIPMQRFLCPVLPLAPVVIAFTATISLNRCLLGERTLAPTEFSETDTHAYIKLRTRYWMSPH